MTEDAQESDQVADRAKAFAREHPYLAFGGLLIPVTYGVTGDPGTALFTGGIVGLGPYIAEGIDDAEFGNDDNDSDEDGDTDE